MQKAAVNFLFEKFTTAFSFLYVESHLIVSQSLPLLQVLAR